MIPVPADSLRALLARVFADPAYHWVTPKSPFQTLQRWWLRLQEWLARLDATHPYLERLMVAGLVVILVVILVHGAWIIVGTLRHASGHEATASPVRSIERRDASWHRREAQRLSREGRYGEALMEEFWALISDLEARQLVRFHPSKTPGEYALEPALGPTDRAQLSVLVSQLYALVFAGRDCRAEDILAWRTAATKEWGAAPR
jgi:hypothetical protein